MEIHAVVTVAPSRRSLSARSMATGDGIKRTDCPIHKTPGRAMNGGGASGPASDRPKISWATRTESARALPSTSYDSRTVGSVEESELLCASAMHFYMCSYIIAFRLGWVKVPRVLPTERASAWYGRR